MFGFKTKRKTPSTGFSDFIQNASSREKKRVYRQVIDDAIRMQDEMMSSPRAISDSK